MTTISRRTVLRGLGTALALPWLEAMAPAAGSMTRPRCGWVSYTCPTACICPIGRPRGMSADLSFQKILQGVESFREQMTVISGLALDGANAHGDGGGDHARSVASFLTGAHPRKTHGDNIRNGRSIDQVIAEHIGKTKRSLPSLELGTEASAPAGKCDSGYSCLYTSNISWRTETSPLAKEVNPANVFERMFGSPVEFENRRALEKENSVIGLSISRFCE